MKATLLKAIAQCAADDLPNLVEGVEDEILEAIHHAAADSDDGAVTFNLKYTIKMNLGKSTQTNTLGWSVSHKTESIRYLPDPDQPELPSIDTSALDEAIAAEGGAE